MRATIALPALLSLGIAVPSCVAPPLDPVDLVPADAVAMLVVRWPEVQGNPRLRQFIPAQAEASLRSLGVEIEQADSVVLFSTGLQAGDELLLVSSATLPEQFAGLAQARGWASELRGRYRHYAATVGGHAVATIGPIVIVGRPDAVNRMTTGDLADRDRFVARRELADLAGAMSGSDAIRLSVVWPTEVTDAARALTAGTSGLLHLGGQGTLATLVGHLGIGRAFALACGSRAADVTCTAAGLLADESTATMVSGGLSLLQGLSAFAPQASAGAGSLPDFTVERQGATVLVRTTLK